MGWDSLAAVVGTGVAVGELIMLQIRSLDGRMSGLESRLCGIEQRLACIEEILERHFASVEESDASGPIKGG